jgi:ferredoxin-NADP reductase
MQSLGYINGIHYCFIVDEIGIASTFPQIKSHLAEQDIHHVSVLYCSSNNHFVFKKELDLLERIFSLQFMVFYENATANFFIPQESIEAILNVNVMAEMNFIISGKEEFIQQVEEQLHFLGIHQIQIQEQLFK